jgi:hypothetical protein
MAELAIGAAALAGLFNNAVDCFEFIQLGRAFGKNFQTSQLKLDNARLRLSRWGKSMDLDQDIGDIASLQGRLEPAADVKQAEDLLGQIITLFADAEGVSKKYRSRTAPQDAGSLAVHNPRTDLDPVIATLHQKMRTMSIERQNRSSVLQKTQWALYQEKHFRRLIENVTGLVDDLVELFPAAEQTQRDLCDAEVSNIGEGEGLSILKEIAAAQDELLDQAIGKASNGKGGSYHAFFSGDYNSGLQLSHNSGTITFGRGG